MFTQEIALLCPNTEARKILIWTQYHDSWEITRIHKCHSLQTVRTCNFQLLFDLEIRFLVKSYQLHSWSEALHYPPPSRHEEVEPLNSPLYVCQMIHFICVIENSVIVKKMWQCCGMLPILQMTLTSLIPHCVCDLEPDLNYIFQLTLGISWTSLGVGN